MHSLSPKNANTSGIAPQNVRRGFFFFSHNTAFQLSPSVIDRPFGILRCGFLKQTTRDVLLLCAFSCISAELRIAYPEALLYGWLFSCFWQSLCRGSSTYFTSNARYSEGKPVGWPNGFLHYSLLLMIFFSIRIKHFILLRKQDVVGFRDASFCGSDKSQTVRFCRTLLYTLYSWPVSDRCPSWGWNLSAGSRYV